MKKFKKKFVLTGLALAVPLVVAIASACSEVSQDGPTPPGGNDLGQGQQTNPAGKGTEQTNPAEKGTEQTNPAEKGTEKTNPAGSIDNLPMFFKDIE